MKLAQEAKSEKNFGVKSFNIRSKKVIECLKNFFVICSYVVIAVAFMSNFGFADKVESLEYSDVFNEFDYILNYVQGKLLELSGVAAIIAVIIGVFMKKFSFGDEERIRTGKRIIRGTLFSYAFILSIDLILSAIQLLVSKTEEG